MNKYKLFIIRPFDFCPVDYSILITEFFCCLFVCLFVLLHFRASIICNFRDSFRINNVVLSLICFCVSLLLLL